MTFGRVQQPEINEEVPFSFDELFFSRTDERGIILSGNQVFQRISMYGWDELLNKPHNLIRHPDMPKAVFWLLWDAIRKGEPIGAYVKNKAKDGRFYWVYAIVTPVTGGYLSVRLKPSSTILPVVEQVYKERVAAERAGMPTAESARMLLEQLKTLGFSDYAAFTATALAKEMAARNTQRNLPHDPTLEHFEDLINSANALLQKSDFISQAYETNQYVPVNLRIQAAQLGEHGNAIGVISGNYSIISSQIREGMTQFMASVQDVSATINHALLLVCTANIQKEVIAFFRTEPPCDAISSTQEMALLQQQQLHYLQQVQQGLARVLQQTGHFQQDCRDMKMLAAGLEVTRVLGKVESAHAAAESSSMGEMINDLGILQTAIATTLREIEQVNTTIKFSTQKLLTRMCA